MKKLLYILAASLAMTLPAKADTVCDNFSTLVNRPTIGYSACNVTSGHVVEELGYQNGNGVAQYPQAFNRLGLTKNLEFDFIGPNFNHSNASGFSDNGVGFKYGLVNNEKFALGVDGLLTFPRDSRYTNGRATSTLNLDAAYNLTSSTGVTATLAFANTGFVPSFVVAQQISRTNDFYIEYVGAKNSYYDYGIQQMIGKKYIVDVELGTGHGVTYTGLGLSFRM